MLIMLRDRLSPHNSPKTDLNTFGIVSVNLNVLKYSM